MTNKWAYFKTFYDYPDYVSRRDALIPQAEAYATSVAGGRPDEPATTFQGKKALQEWGDIWSLLFHKKMNELAVEAGLCEEIRRNSPALGHQGKAGTF